MQAVAYYQLIVWLNVVFAVPFPAALPTGQPNEKPTSITLTRREARGKETAHAVLRDQTTELFAFEQWKRSEYYTSSAVRDARHPQSTIFNHLQWEELAPTNTPSVTQSAGLIFAYEQWEDGEDQTSPDHKEHLTQGDRLEKDDADLPETAQSEENETRNPQLKAAKRASEEHKMSSRDGSEVGIFEYSQWERREHPDESKMNRRKDITTGPVFFAKVQWDES
ncbi:hypothetical protein B0H10DRAFT_1996975 [Mycena sp. CBHHK59/15]|nr:hypothetical protein B0H10DRAFT_1996975 [Mycena sp. CBHHK59/15]